MSTARRYIPTLFRSDAGATTASSLDAGAAVRRRLNEKQFPQMVFPLHTEPLDREFAGLAAKIDKILDQLDVQIVAAEDASAVIHAIRDVGKIAACPAQRS